MFDGPQFGHVCNMSSLNVPLIYSRCSAFEINDGSCFLYNIGIDSFVDTQRGPNAPKNFFVRSDLEELGLKNVFELKFVLQKNVQNFKINQTLTLIIFLLLFTSIHKKLESVLVRD